MVARQAIGDLREFPLADEPGGRPFQTIYLRGESDLRRVTDLQMHMVILAVERLQFRLEVGTYFCHGRTKEFPHLVGEDAATIFCRKNPRRIPSILIQFSGEFAKIAVEPSMPVQLALFPEVVELTRVRPEMNERRFYRLEIQPDLFGRTLLVRRWGRIGTSGRQRLELHPDAGTALNALAQLARNKRRRGYRAA